MRCQFCGWDNPQGKETCEKCNKPLGSSVSEVNDSRHESFSGNQSRPTDRQVDISFNPKATVRENKCQDNVEICPNCGYKLDNGECPSCGYLSSQAGCDCRKTQRPKRKNVEEEIEKTKKTFSLIPISEETGQPEGDAILYEGGDVVLNRENTDPNNSTITSDQQACVSFEDGTWGIEDKSGLQTTFIQAARRIVLHEGDLILMGNQLYRFEP